VLRSAKPVAGVETRQKWPLATTKPIHMRHDTTPIEAAIIWVEVLTRLSALVVVLEQQTENTVANSLRHSPCLLLELTVIRFECAPYD
jgi:hypothetical protein